ncbi:hypothetical protein J4448_02095 [Candidatus Woesearchaeota archaeon]|nr:hypothetical protein [Candidatus Woesearchaeota archaeon]
MWIGELNKKLNRNKTKITFSPHLFDRQEYWNINIEKIEETVRTGKIFEKKCEIPNKICFKRYFGKENTTYTVIAIYHNNFIEVKTAWPKKGR